MSGVIIQDKETAKELNDLARHQRILQLEQDILMDMQICEIEGWDKLEYITMLRELINGFGKRGKENGFGKRGKE